jgi:hypothetical protein
MKTRCLEDVVEDMCARSRATKLCNCSGWKDTATRLIRKGKKVRCQREVYVRLFARQPSRTSSEGRIGGIESSSAEQYREPVQSDGEFASITALAIKNRNRPMLS